MPMKRVVFASPDARRLLLDVTSAEQRAITDTDTAVRHLSPKCLQQCVIDFLLLFALHFTLILPFCCT